MINKKLLGQNLLSDKEDIDLHMFGVIVENRIMRNGDNTLIITKKTRRRERNLKFL